MPKSRPVARAKLARNVWDNVLGNLFGLERLGRMLGKILFMTGNLTLKLD
jgi:hypothetical protein